MRHQASHSLFNRPPPRYCKGMFAFVLCFWLAASSGMYSMLSAVLHPPRVHRHECQLDGDAMRSGRYALEFGADSIRISCAFMPSASGSTTSGVADTTQQRPPSNSMDGILPETNAVAEPSLSTEAVSSAPTLSVTDVHNSQLQLVAVCACSSSVIVSV